MTLRRFVREWWHNAVSIMIPVASGIATLWLYRVVAEVAGHIS